MEILKEQSSIYTTCELMCIESFSSHPSCAASPANTDKNDNLEDVHYNESQLYWCPLLWWIW